MKDKLVYHESLKVGTDLLPSGVAYTAPVTITLESVDDDWSNINMGIEIFWTCNGSPGSSKFLKYDLKNPQDLNLMNSAFAHVVRIPYKNEISIDKMIRRAPAIISKITVI